VGISPPPGPQPSGHPGLTWTNKYLHLLVHEDGSYEWIDPSGYRIAEESNPSCDHEGTGITRPRPRFAAYRAG
jgi:hypothetical protein